MNGRRPGSAHDRYRERLAVLAGDLAPAEAIAEAGRRTGLWSAERRWVRNYGRFYPDREPFVTMVFETDDEQPQLLCLVDAYTNRPAAWVMKCDAGWLSATPFPCDQKLPSLVAALNHPGRRTVVRYRPGSRCTIRFDDPNGEASFAKVYCDDAGELSHVHGQMLWEAAGRQELEFVVARPDRWDAAKRTLWQIGIPGLPLTSEHLRRADVNLARRMGRAAASLVRSTVRPLAVYDWADHFVIAGRFASQLCARVSRLSSMTDGLMHDFQRAHDRIAARPKRPIHGSLSRTQWVEATSRIGLVDFDKLALGDPEFDVAAFLAELDYERLQSDQISDAFLGSYEDVSGPLDHRLIDLYSAHERLEKALKTARAVRADGDVLAEHHLGLALAECEEASR